MLQTTGTITAPGTTALMAGVTVAAQGFGVHDGTYLIMTAHHKLGRSNGYETEVDLRKVQT